MRFSVLPTTWQVASHTRTQRGAPIHRAHLGNNICALNVDNAGKRLELICYLRYHQHHVHQG